ncbi:hypothetical protein [uncultured Roseobacter sp.]|uniref:hypothetical protein n=1 Tax=uncultured Roseobacter sp. TaxID=114847 RepID=UPI002620B9F7|nr:hypothetical protein [uncultured Roseobacter sp.]
MIRAVRTYLPSAIIMGCLLGSAGVAQTLTCQHHTEGADGRSFAATIELNADDPRPSARITALQLSAPWPLPDPCDSPLGEDPLHLDAVRDNGLWKLGPSEEAACGYTLYIELQGANPAMLAPRRSYKVFGEVPFLSRCTVRAAS